MSRCSPPQGATPLFIETVKIFWPLELALLMIKDTIGVDGSPRHQRLLVEEMANSDHVLFMVIKSLKVPLCLPLPPQEWGECSAANEREQQLYHDDARWLISHSLHALWQAGMVLDDKVCQQFYERLLRGAVKVSILRYQERSDRLTAAELQQRMQGEGSTEWVEDSLDFLEEKLVATAQRLNMDLSAVDDVINGIRGRCVTVRAMLGASLLTNPILAAQHPNLLDETGMRGLLSILVGAANDSTLRLAKEVHAVVDKALTTLRSVKAAVGERLSDKALNYVRSWEGNKKTMELWAGSGSVLAQGITQRVQVSWAQTDTPPQACTKAVALDPLSVAYGWVSYRRRRSWTRPSCSTTTRGSAWWTA